MTTLLYAQPYDISAEGFYFRSSEEYDREAVKAKNSYGDKVEEFEIQFIDGETIDCDLAKAWGINQANLHRFFDVVDEWQDYQKTTFIIAVGECGEAFDPETVHPDDFDVEIYEDETMKDLAFRFVDEGLFGEVPKAFEFYIDYDTIARDLAIDYSEAKVGGCNVIFRCA